MLKLKQACFSSTAAACTGNTLHMYWRTAVALTNAQTDNVHSSSQPLYMYPWIVPSKRRTINFSHISILPVHHHLPTSLHPMHFMSWTSATSYTKSAIYIKFLTMNIHNAVQSGTMVHGHFRSEEHTASTLKGVARHAENVVSCVEESRFEKDVRSFRTHNKQLRRSISLEVFT